MTNHIDLAMAELSGTERYKLLCAVVVPRPIALVTTLDETGEVNAAPFSFFNVFSETPPLVILGVQSKADGTRKDTARHIRRNGEFVVNLVDEDLAQAMNDCAIDFPPDEGEVEALGLVTCASRSVAVPFLERAPFALECRLTQTTAVGPERELVVGEVVHVHARHSLLDRDRLHVDIERYRPFGRLFADLYARQRDVVRLERESYQSFAARRAAARDKG